MTTDWAKGAAPETLKIAPTFFEGHWYVVDADTPERWHMDSPEYVRKDLYDAVLEKVTALARYLKDGNLTAVEAVITELSLIGERARSEEPE